MASIKALLLAGFVMVINAANCQLKLNLENPPASPLIFGENIISTPSYERDFAISPDGAEIFYTMQVLYSNFQALVHVTKKGSSWSKPEVVSFSGKFSDLEPVFSPDGKKLFFVSNRPLQGDKIKDFDIWYVEKLNGKWNEPKNLGAPVNTEADEFYPSISLNGNLYYTAQYKGGVGREDIYVSKFMNGSYLAPVPLDTTINTTMFEFNAFVSPDEQFIIFSSQGRNDDKGRGDLYISVKDAHGKWKKAQNIAKINSDRLDYCPYVSPNKKILFFTSESHDLKRSFEKPVNYNSLVESFRQARNGLGNIYWVDIRILNDYLK